VVDRLPYTSVVLDAGVFIKHLKGPRAEDPPEHTTTSTDVITAAIAGEFEAYVPAIVIAEVIYGGDKGEEAHAIVDGLMSRSMEAGLRRPAARSASTGACPRYGDPERHRCALRP
jgi:hypothetical protein